MNRSSYGRRPVFSDRIADVAPLRSVRQQQDVNKKAADELGDGKRHRFLAVAPLHP
jgi:hypothetical protein